MPHELFEQIKKILVERFAIPSAKIQLQTDLQTQLNLDSMDALDLLLAINDTFKIQIAEEQLRDIHTVSDLMIVIKKYKPSVDF